MDSKQDLYELNSLGCPLWAENEMDEILAWMVKDINIYVNKNEYSFTEKYGLYQRRFPRFGIYSTLLKDINVFIFDNPILEETLGDTACTDGTNIFFNFKFFKELIKMEDENKENRLGIVPVILHEVSHILDNDVFRYKNVKHIIANVSSDIRNNAYIKKSFYNIKWLPSLIDLGFGLKAGDEHYAEKSSEYVLIDVLEKINNDKSPIISQEEINRINSNEYLDVEKGRSIDNISKSLENEKIENHVIDKKDLIDVLNKAGLPHVAQALGLDLKNVEDSIQKNKKAIADIINLKIEEIEKIQKKAGLNEKNTPAGKLVSEIKEKISFSKKAKLTWVQHLTNEIWGEGGKEQYNQDQPNDIYYVDDVSEMIGFELFEGTIQKVKSNDIVLVIVDTSKSMEKEDLSLVFSELFELKRSSFNDNMAKEIVVVFADADIKKDHVIIIDENNFNEVFEKRNIDVIGGGGTNFKRSINSALQIKEIEGKNLSSTIIFTDLYDEPPKKDEIILNENQKRTNFTYISVNNNDVYVENFRKKVSDYANVVPINNSKLKVDLSNNQVVKEKNKSKLKM